MRTSGRLSDHDMRLPSHKAKLGDARLSRLATTEDAGYGHTTRAVRRGWPTRCSGHSRSAMTRTATSPPRPTPGGVVSTAAYDGRGLASGTSYSDGTPTAGFTYDAAGQPKTVTDAMGKRTYGYDAANQLTSITPDTGKGKPRGLAALPACVDVRTAGPAATRADGH